MSGFLVLIAKFSGETKDGKNRRSKKKKQKDLQRTMLFRLFYRNIQIFFGIINRHISKWINNYAGVKTGFTPPTGIHLALVGDRPS